MLQIKSHKPNTRDEMGNKQNCKNQLHQGKYILHSPTWLISLFQSLEDSAKFLYFQKEKQDRKLQKLVLGMIATLK